MKNKIYVGNLNYSTTEEQLEELFATYGSVASTVIITDKYTDQSKGFGFVEMAAEDTAAAAISALNGSELGNREIRVSEAHDKKRDSSRSYQY